MQSSVPAAKCVAVSLALLLAACATPPREVTAPPAEAVAPPAAGPAVVPATSPGPSPEPAVTARAAPPAETPPPPAVPPEMSFRQFVAANDERLLEIYVGTHRTVLARIMRHGVGRWPNPYRHESLHDRAGKDYEVFYYLTRDPEGKPVKSRHLTPVIVKEDMVVAFGAYRLKKLRRGVPLDLPRRGPKRAS